MTILNPYKIFRMEYSVRKIHQDLTIFHYITPILQLLNLIIFLLMKVDYRFEGPLLPLRNILQSFRFTYLTIQFANIWIILANASNALSIICSFLRLRLIPNLEEVSTHKKLQNALLIVTVVIGYVTHLQICLAVWSFTKFCQVEGVIIAFIKCIIPLSWYTYYSFKDDTISLYGVATVPLAFMVTFEPTLPLFVAVITISLYLTINQKFVVKKVCSGLFIIVALFVMKNCFFSQQNQHLQIQIELLCLGIVMLLTPILVFSLRGKFDNSTVDQKIQRSFRTLSHLKTDHPHSQMQFKQFYELYADLTSLDLLNKQLKSKQIEKIYQKSPESITKQQFLEILQKFVESESKDANKNSPLKQMTFLRVQIALNRPQHYIIQDLINLYEEMQKSNGSITCQFYELFSQVLHKYSLFKDKELQVAYIVSTNNQKEAFENKVRKFLEKLDLFWHNMGEQQMSVPYLDQSLSEVILAHKQIQMKFKQVSHKGHFVKEEKVFELSRDLLNSYLLQRRSLSLDVARLNEKNEEDTNLSFIILQNNLIKFVSKDLLISLGKKNSLTFENNDKEFFFGNEFSKIVDNLIMNMTANSQFEWTTVPIVPKEGFLQLRRIKILWYPSLEAKNKYLIKFTEDSDFINDSLLCYSYESDTIRYFNKNFITRFQLNESQFRYEINNSQIVFNEIFVDAESSFENLRQKLKDQTTFKCKIYLKKYVQKEVPFISPVQISVLRTVVKQENSEYCILKINKLKDNKALLFGTNASATKKHNNSNYSSERENKVHKKSESWLVKKYANENFFCKIPNHYDTKITEKQNQLEDEGRWSYRYFIHILFGLMFLGIMVFWAIEFKYLEQRIIRYKDQIQAISNTSEQYALLYQSYSIILARYYLQNFLVKYVPSPAIFPWDLLDEFYKTSQQTFLDDFLHRYLTQINNQPNAPIDYKLDFDYFSINTSTLYTTMMDFAQNFKTHISTSNVPFLLNNYESFRNLTIKYEEEFQTEEVTNKIIAPNENFIGVFISMTVVLLTVILVLVVKIQRTIDIIYVLINKIEPKMISSYKRILEKKKQDIHDLFEKKTIQIKGEIKVKGSTRRSTQNSSSSLDSQYKYSDQSKSDVRVDQTQQITQEPIDLEQKDKSNSTLDQINDFSDGQNEIIDQKASSLSVKETKHQQKNRIEDKQLLVRFLTKVFFLALIGGFSVVFYLDLQHLKEEKAGIKQLFDIQRKLYVALLHVKRQQVDAPMLPTMKDFYKSSRNDTFHNGNVELVTPIPTQIILDELKDFKQEGLRILSTNMCLTGGAYATDMEGFKKCKDYLNGTVSKGFSEAFSPYKQNAKKVAAQQFWQLSSFPCTETVCSEYQEHLTVSVLMGQTMRHLIQRFSLKTDSCFEQMVKNTKLRTANKLLGLVLVGILYFAYSQFLRKKCRLAIKYFTIIPKSIMCTIKLVSFLRKQNILTKLDIL